MKNENRIEFKGKAYVAISAPNKCDFCDLKNTEACTPLFQCREWTRKDNNEVLWKGNKKDLTTFLSTLPPLELTCQYKDRGAEFYEYNSAYLVGIKDELAYVMKGKE